MKPERPHMGLRIQRDAALYALGLDPGNVEWHHAPPLEQRPVVDGKWEPDANDARFIIPLAKEAHRERTAKVDIPAIAKTRRLETRHIEFQARCLAKTGQADKPRDVRKKRIPSKPFRRGR